jgi:hypothetical protein
MFHHPSIGDAIRSPSHPAWVDPLGRVFYCPDFFADLMDFESTFPARLMRNGNDISGRRLTDRRQDLRNLPGFR